MSSSGVQSQSDDTEDQSQSPSLNKLCDDALILVLRLLGCEDLQRCRLVCRRWRDLVQHPDVWRHRALGLLPNGFLIRVMRYCNTNELLPLRLVCRRWRDLAMHPGVWRHRFIKGWLLRLPPPCCGTLYLSSYYEDYLSLAATAMCPATDIVIFVKVGEANKALQVVRHQAGLGSLRSLHLTVRDPFFYNNFDVVLSVEGLRELEVWQCCKPEKLSIIRSSCFPAAAPSLRKLTYQGMPGSDPLLESLLQAVALSLEDLDLYCTEFHNFHSDMTVARLLSKCSNLRKLSCPFLGGFEQLLACRSLTDLEISTTVDVVQGADEEDARCAISSLYCFLRSAPHLTHLSFWFENFETVTDLFRALDGAGHSQITSLKVLSRVNWTKEQADRLWELVVPILPNFPRLEELTANLPGLKVNYLRKNAAKNRVNCFGSKHMSFSDDDDNDNVDF